MDPKEVELSVNGNVIGTFPMDREGKNEIKICQSCICINRVFDRGDDVSTTSYNSRVRGR